MKKQNVGYWVKMREVKSNLSKKYLNKAFLNKPMPKQTESIMKHLKNVS